MDQSYGRWRAGIRRFLAQEQGVTLLEVLIVIMIMGFIATLGSIQLTKYFSRARVDAAKLQMNEVGVALDLFKLDVGRYPSNAEGLDALLKSGSTINGWRGPYLKRDSILKDPWGRAYLYSNWAETGGYRLVSHGNDGQQGGEGDNADIIVQMD
ncbi:MAG: type II secretion system major pseudopilin GspG [Beijerinckiaceae bacterium]|nr:type II secretion system major pseudopilin GspG [Beijerinckiaceae bacterium]MCZ8298995.1 type II secretion system major pseudopilin GspG [Beijerinckiaceae bacterium]